uniref:Matrin-type domain-containing protein n=1 Tax=Parascaris univalens TaxID=6257 RepID=A0A915C995_PARUN
MGSWLVSDTDPCKRGFGEVLLPLKVMTDVWKSNARKFCEICKVWFADNKVSIAHHEGGRKHKEAIQAKLRQLGKQSRQKEKDQAALRSTLAAMESAAQKSMASGSGGMTNATDLPCSMIGPSPKPRTYVDPRAHSSSVIEMAKEMARRKMEKEEAAKIATKSQHWRQDDDEESTEKSTIKGESKKEEEEIVWAEANSDGISYYFHIYSGGWFLV